MPIYEYVCPACDHRFQAMRGMSERLAPVACDACGTETTTLALSVPGKVGAGAQGPAPACARGIPGCAGGGCAA